MNDRFLLFLIYATTPIMLVLGLGVMYAIIGDHPWFLYMAAGYTVLLIILYLTKISLFRTLLAKRNAALSKKTEHNG